MTLRKTSALFMTTIMGVGTITFATMPASQAQEGCSAVHIISVNGTGGSSPDQSTAISGNASGGLAAAMLDQFPGQVSAYNVPYPASAGVLASTAARVGADGTTYGNSRIQGVQNAVAHIKDYISKCGDTKLLFTGYSQGAHVAGDIAAVLAHGAVPGVTADSIMGAVLYSDPGRSGNSQYTGISGERKAYIPVPANFQYQRNGELANPTQKDGTVGWTGQRSLDFKGLEGKIISLCNPVDMACSVTDKSLLQDVANMSDKNWRPKMDHVYNSDTTMKSMMNSGKLGVLLNYVLSGPISEKLLAGDITGGVYDLNKVVNNLDGFNDHEKEVISQGLREVLYLLNILRSERGYGDSVSEKDILAHIIQEAGPGLINTLPIPPEQRAGATAVLKILGGGSTAGIPDDIKKKTAAMIKYAAAFGSEHGKYFGGEGSIQVNGMSADAWAKQATAEGIRNVINNTPYTVNPGGSTRPADSQHEVSNPDRLSDGLEWIVDSSFTGDEGELDQYGFPRLDGKFVNFDDPMGEDTPTDGSTGDGASSDDLITDLPTTPGEDETSDDPDDGETNVDENTSSEDDTADGSTQPGGNIMASQEGDFGYGPKVNTGGAVKQASFWEKIVSIFS